MINTRETGIFIAHFRKTHGLTQEKFASQFDVSHQAVSKWKNGIAFPDIGTLVHIANTIM